MALSTTAIVRSDIDSPGWKGCSTLPAPQAYETQVCPSAPLGDARLGNSFTTHGRPSNSIAGWSTGVEELAGTSSRSLLSVAFGVDVDDVAILRAEA
jgi:hypothetical protein